MHFKQYRQCEHEKGSKSFGDFFRSESLQASLLQIRPNLGSSTDIAWSSTKSPGYSFFSFRGRLPNFSSPSRFPPAISGSRTSISFAGTRSIGVYQLDWVGHVGQPRFVQPTFRQREICEFHFASRFFLTLLAFPSACPLPISTFQLSESSSFSSAGLCYDKFSAS